METEQKDEWRLQKIELEFQRWGDDKGKYIGKITFENGEVESFTFRIRPNTASMYIELISKDVVKCANQLSNRLLKSFNLINKT